MKRILVPTDFSEQSEYALEVAAQLAKKFKSEIYLLHMIDLPVHLATAPSTELPEAMFFMQLANQRFEKFKNKPFLKGIPVFDAVEANIPHLGIAQAVKDNEIDLVIMGSSGASGLKEMFIGSNTEKVVRTSEVPVLTIKKQTPDFKIDHLVYACDFEPESFNAYKRAIEFCSAFKSKLHLLYVNTPNEFTKTQEGEEKINSFISKLKPENHTINVFNDETVESGILNFATSINADAIGISTHGRKGLAHFFNGSISEDLVNHAIRPVITFKI